MYGKSDDFAYLKEDSSRYIIGYNKTEIDSEHCEWYEVYFYKKNRHKPTLDDIKNAILEDINAQTDEKILSGFVWNDIPVWLSAESQRNFSEAQRAGEMNPKRFTPVLFKLGESNGTPVYHQFDTAEELTDFYFLAQDYIRQCLAEGWQMKDAVDFTPYEALFTQSENENAE